MYSTLIQSIILTMSFSVLDDAPPDSAEIAAALDSDPVEVLVFIARTGWTPDWLSPDSIVMDLLEMDLPYLMQGAWAASVAGFHLPVAIDPVLIEFGGEAVIPDVFEVAEDSELLNAALRHVQHAVSRGEEPTGLEELVEVISGSWDRIPIDSRILCLEVLGRQAIDITGDLPDSGIEAAGIQAAARYCVELGITRDFTVFATDPALTRIYAAGCSGSENAVSMLGDPLWAVRYSAAVRCPPSLIGELLADSVSYVALTASIARAGDGFSDGRQKIRELALMDGPVGHKAAEHLGISDSTLIRRIMTDDSPGRRAAAQTAWLQDSCAVDSMLSKQWISDPYWLIPISWAWHLVDSSDSTEAAKVLNRICETIGNFDDPDLIIEYTDILLSRLEGEGEEETEGESDSFVWQSYSVPFDPVEISTPDTVVILTDKGDFIVLLWKDTAPIACSSFWYLVQEGFYDGLRFHRVIPGFVAQVGCPQGNGTGGPGYLLPNERSIRHFGRGALGMADAGLNTAGSQFFIMLDDHGRLDGRYTAFGEVLNPQELDEITVGTVITGIYELAYRPGIY